MTTDRVGGFADDAHPSPHDRGSSRVHRSFVDLADGQIHVVTAGAPEATPVLLLHQTPRSWREFDAVIPLLAGRFRPIAVDTLGFGDSDRPTGRVSIERWAGVVADVMDHLGIERVHVVGHHTGGVIAVELAAQRPDLVARLVLSSTPYTHAEFRRERAERPPIDEVRFSDDGAHLAALWNQRAGFYPADRPDLLQAFVIDALKVFDDVEGGHTAVATYRMEDRIRLVASPTLVVRATEDPFAFGHGIELRDALVGAASVDMVDIAGGMVPLPDQLPEEFAGAVMSFLDGHDLDDGSSV
ncbi:MAG: alpha/beta fold hydrolase [Ilumatobacter sp.]|uniref:alpha/beta fold hydrolase n=1 Tax=Ilumatobacter sp. TaxID=1967498 RepID=UPI00391D536F